jgi:hypothetical protein
MQIGKRAATLCQIRAARLKKTTARGYIIQQDLWDSKCVRASSRPPRAQHQTRGDIFGLFLILLRARRMDDLQFQPSVTQLCLRHRYTYTLEDE